MVWFGHRDSELQAEGAQGFSYDAELQAAGLEAHVPVLSWGGLLGGSICFLPVTPLHRSKPHR